MDPTARLSETILMWVSALESVRLKINRAQDHLDALNMKVDALERRQPYRFRTSSNLDRTRHEVRAVVQEEFPATWGLDVGDFVHNLRSALDHLVWSLVLSHGATPTNRTEFPIFLEEADYRRGAVQKIAGLPADVMSEFEALQPYRCPVADIEAALQPLWLVQQMDIVDKHRLLHLVRCIADSTELTTPDVFPGGTMKLLALDAITDGTLIAEFTTSSPLSPIQIGGFLSAVVMIEETDRTPRLSWGVLAAMRDAVRAAVARLTPFLA